MGALDPIAKLIISVNSTGVTRQGFGVIGILAPNAAFGPERTRSYSSLDAFKADFAATTPEYKAAQAVLAQNPKIPILKALRCANKPTQTWKIAVLAVANTKVYKFYVGGDLVTYTSDGSATNDEIVAGLAAAYDLLTGHTLASTQPGTVGSKTLLLTGTAAGTFDEVSLPADNSMLALLSLEQTTADPTVVDDLTAIFGEDPNVFGIVNCFQSPAIITAIAAYAEANLKLFMPDTADTPAITHALSGATDICQAEHALAHRQTALSFHAFAGEFLGAAWMGRGFPFAAGSFNYFGKTLSGVTPDVLTDTHKANLKDKNANYYTNVVGAGRTIDGRTAQGQYIDQTVGLNAFSADIQENVADVLFAEDKVSGDDGLHLLKAAMTASMEKFERQKLFEPGWVVQAPTWDGIPSSDLLIRLASGFLITAVFARTANAVEIGVRVTP